MGGRSSFFEGDFQYPTAEHPIANIQVFAPAAHSTLLKTMPNQLNFEHRKLDNWKFLVGY